MKNSLKILTLEEQSVAACLLKEALEHDGAIFQAKHTATVADFGVELANFAPDLIVCRHSPPHCDGIAGLILARRECGEAPFIFISEAANPDTALRALQLGATDHVPPGQTERLVFAVRRALREVREHAEREQTSAALREMEERYRALFDRSLDCLYVHDFEGRFLDANPAGLALLGYTREEIPTVNLQTLLSADQLPRAAQCQEEVRRTGTQKRLQEFTLKHKDGSHVIVEVIASLIVRDGKPFAIQGIGRDITARKKMEAQLLRSQRMESIGTLASGIAHDLNNVLSPILMCSQLLSTCQAEEERKEWIAMIVRSAERGASLIKQILSFGRGAEGHRLELQVRTLISDVNDIIRQTFPKSIKFQSRMDDNLWTVLADPTQLHQVLLNLCVNARDAMPRGGVLTLAAENTFLDAPPTGGNGDGSPHPYLMITVADTGTGIPPEIREKIFDPFFTTKEVGKGTGLGLSTSQNIVKSHGGFINVYSEANAGTVFKVYIPAMVPAEEANRQAGEEHYPRGKGELVLVVDDEAGVRNVTSQTLKIHGYNVITARDGAEAIELYEHHARDVAVILIDMMMPVMDGGSAVQALCRTNENLKIIAASGRFTEARMAGAGEAIKAFLPKPYTAERLLKTIRNVLACQPTASSDAQN